MRVEVMLTKSDSIGVLAEALNMSAEKLRADFDDWVPPNRYFFFEVDMDEETYKKNYMLSGVYFTKLS